MSYLESEEEVSSTDKDLQKGRDMLNIDDPGPSEGLVCTSPHLSICSGDFGQVVKLKSAGIFILTDDDKYSLLRHCVVAPPSYTFPTHEISGRQRSFQHSWLGKYSGLCYSVTDNGGYSKYCVLFAKCSPSVAQPGVLVERPFTNFKKASEILGDHFHGTGHLQCTASKGRCFHQAAVELAMSFLAVIKNKSQGIDTQLNSIRRNVAENRLKLKSIVETIILCGRARNFTQSPSR